MSLTPSETRPEGPRVLVIEDLRTFKFPAVYARTLAEAWVQLFSFSWDQVWFDHDMGLTMESDNTYALAVEMERRAQEGAPLPVGEIVVHTANPNGGDRLMAALSKWYNVRRVDANDYLAPGEGHMYWTGGDNR